MAAGALAARAENPPGVEDLGPAITWTRLGSTRDDLGTHTRWAQRLHGIPVLDSEVITHESGGAVLAPTGSLALPRGPGGRPFLPPVLGAHDPALTGPQVLDRLLARFGPRKEAPGHTTPRHVYFPTMATLDLAGPGERDAMAHPSVVKGYVLACEIDVRWPGHPGDPRDASYVLQAHTGRLLAERPRVRSLDAPARIKARTWYSGDVDLDVTRLDGGPRMVLKDPHRGRGGGNTVEDQEGGPNTVLARVVEIGADSGGGDRPDCLQRGPRPGRGLGLLREGPRAPRVRWRGKPRPRPDQRPGPRRCPLGPRGGHGHPPGRRARVLRAHGPPCDPGS